MLSRSIQGSFLTWLTVLLVVVITGFGAILFYSVRHSKLAETDAELEGAAQILAAKMRGGPPRRPPRPGTRRRESDPRRPDFRPPVDDRERQEGRFLRPSRRGPRRDMRRAHEQFLDRLDLPESFLRRFGTDREGAPYFAIWRGDGMLLKESNMPADLERPENPGYRQSTIRTRAETLREIVLDGPRGSTILVGQSVAKELADLARLVGLLFAIGGGVLALGSIGAWILAKRAIRPVMSITAAADAISASNLSQRIDIESTKTELGRLAKVLNDTFDRLQSSFEQQTRFTADASHELRTPVAVILAQTEMARRSERTPEEYREVIDACHAVAMRMKLLVDGLLTLARTDAGVLHVQMDQFDLAVSAEENARLMESLALEREVTLRLDVRPTQLRGDRDKINQVIANLLANAIRHTPRAGEVTVQTKPAGDEAVLSVADTGRGIAPEHIDKIFERFYRIDSARTGKEGSTGLGLAISKAIVDAHGGSLRCESELERGSVFTMRLPRRDLREEPEATSATPPETVRSPEKSESRS